MPRKVSQSNSFAWLSCLTATVLCLLVTGPVGAASVDLLIDDFAEEPISATVIGDVTGSAITVTQEGIGQQGVIDVTFHYISSDATAPGAGQTLTYNYNIYEDAAQTILSDTWSISLIGSGGGLVTVHAIFLSDSLDEISPTPLPSAVALTENQTLPPPDNQPDSTYQYVGPLLSDLVTGFNSASVPEPSTFLMLGIGVVGLGCYNLRRRGRARPLA